MLLPLLAAAVLAAGPEPLATTAEQTRWKKTGRYDEVERLCAAFEKRFPGKARCSTFGTTPEGRALKVLVASESGALDAASARKKGVPAVLFQGGIHAGEIDGKDAGFQVLRGLLEGTLAPGALRQVVAVFVPVLNADGHERFGAHNRPNQVGPEEMGWRTSSRNLNLNRDYVKADAPETQALLRLLHAWDPLVYLDLHVTDGANFQPDVSVMMEPVHVGPDGMKQAGKQLLDDVVKGLEANGHKPLTFYPAFQKDDDPSSGFAQGVAPPRFSSAYWSAHHRWGVLVETHSWKDYATRVRATHDTVLAFLLLVGKQGAALRRAAADADDGMKRMGGEPVTLTWGDGKHSVMMAFPGYAYTREPSPISGAVRVRYDPTRPTTWTVPFFPEPVPEMQVDAPRGGYVVPPGWAGVVRERLDLHAIRYTTVAAARPAMKCRQFRMKEPVFRPVPYEGRQTVAVKGEWEDASVPVAAGSLYVPVAQPAGLMVLHLFEPRAPDSFVSWGFFSAVLEQKEYMEPYVAEQVAEQLLQDDPALRDEFMRKLVDDPVFAKDPAARLDFFYRRHPSFDRAMNLYPVLRTDGAP
ncbi:MAG: peptidase M14 [Deltaproteobacteria bacterium]|nr:peptidase M14 [Deltaproteobacteria bacterium]